MNYATLQEAYNEESFEKKRKKVPKEKFTNSEYSNQEECYYKNKFNIDTGSCPEKFTNPNKKEKVSENTIEKVIKPREQPEISPSIYNIQPYYDEDLDKYLNINDFNKRLLNDDKQIDIKQIIEDKTEEKMEKFINPYNPILHDDKQNNKQTNNKKDIFYKNIINIGLFIFIGILIIFICEQISEIAINIGMRRTFLLLEPYLEKIQKNI